jgi:hypothetical protein
MEQPLKCEAVSKDGQAFYRLTGEGNYLKTASHKKLEELQSLAPLLPASYQNESGSRHV